MNSRFIDPGTAIHDLGDHFLVVCSRCSRCALVRVQSSDEQCTATVTCASCGYAQSRKTRFRASPSREAIDWYFRLPLWLSTPCCGETLWALNSEHLVFLESFVGAQLRQRSPSADQLPDRNRLLASRVPA